MLAVMSRAASEILLPAPRREGACALEQALWMRRSVREYDIAPLALADLAQLAWAAQGIVSEDGHRTAPSAGALYPLTLRAAIGDVRDASTGLYRYDPSRHRFLLAAEGDKRKAFAVAASDQRWIERASAVLLIASLDVRTTGKYGARGLRYVEMEAGHAAQNVLLQAASLGLGAAIVGAFDDDELDAAAALAPGERALCLVPVGHPRRNG